MWMEMEIVREPASDIHCHDKLNKHENQAL